MIKDSVHAYQLEKMFDYKCKDCTKSLYSDKFLFSKEFSFLCEACSIKQNAPKWEDIFEAEFLNRVISA